MATLLSNVITIQNEIVKLKENITSLNAEEARSLQVRLDSYLALQASGGRAPTKRDDMGNVILYEDFMIPGQLQRADQYVTVEMIKPDYDDAQANEVLDTEINELYTPQDKSEIARLRRLIEELRQQLRDATIGDGTGGDGTGDGTGEPPTPPASSRFPKFAIELPDVIAGEISNTPILLTMNTAIFNDTNMKLENFGGGNPFSINWWLIDHATEEIYAQGVNDTFIQNINNENKFGDKDLDAVLELTVTPINFNGWYVNDQSDGKLENYFKFSDDRIVRFRFKKRRLVGNSTIDPLRNTYYIIPSFLNEVPKFHNKEHVTVNIDTANVNPGQDIISRIGYFKSAEFIIKEEDETGKVWQETTVVSPVSVIAYTGNRLTVIAPRKVFGNEVNVNSIAFSGWYSKNSLTSNYDKVSSELTYSTNLLISETFNWIAGYKIAAPTDEDKNDGIDDGTPTPNGDLRRRDVE